MAKKSAGKRKAKTVKVLRAVGDKQAARVKGGADASQVLAPEYTRTADGSVSVGRSFTPTGR